MNKFIEYINADLPIKKELLSIFKKETPSNIFDIGACEGEDSIRYGLLFKDVNIYSFEPLPDNFKMCKNNFNKFPYLNIKCYPYALSDKNGFEKFYVSSGQPDGTENDNWNYGNKSSSLFPPNPGYKKLSWLKYNNIIEVECKTLYSFCKENNIKIIDFIHMDVQGAELKVLKGADNFIRQVKVIWLEVENVPIYLEQPLKKDIETFMKVIHFKKIIDTANNKDSGDQLYINLDFFKRYAPFILKIVIIDKMKKIYSPIVSLKKRIKNIINL